MASYSIILKESESLSIVEAMSHLHILDELKNGTSSIENGTIYIPSLKGVVDTKFLDHIPFSPVKLSIKNTTNVIVEAIPKMENGVIHEIWIKEFLPEYIFRKLSTQLENYNIENTGIVKLLIDSAKICLVNKDNEFYYKIDFGKDVPIELSKILTDISEEDNEENSSKLISQRTLVLLLINLCSPITYYLIYAGIVFENKRPHKDVHVVGKSNLILTDFGGKATKRFLQEKYSYILEPSIAKGFNPKLYTKEFVFDSTPILDILKVSDTEEAVLTLMDETIKVSVNSGSDYRNNLSLPYDKVLFKSELRNNAATKIYLDNEHPGQAIIEVNSKNTSFKFAVFYFVEEDKVVFKPCYFALINGESSPIAPYLRSILPLTKLLSASGVEDPLSVVHTNLTSLSVVNDSVSIVFNSCLFLLNSLNTRSAVFSQEKTVLTNKERKLAIKRNEPIDGLKFTLLNIFNTEEKAVKYVNKELKVRAEVTPHDRRGHWRNYASGKRSWVQSTKVLGGREHSKYLVVSKDENNQNQLIDLL